MNYKTVFLLQDTKEANDTLKAKFDEREDFKVVGMAENGAEAVDKIIECNPDFLITELVLSGSDGLSVIKQVKMLNLSTNIVVTSALCGDEIVHKTISEGASYFIAKPLNFQSLIDHLKNFYFQEITIKESRARRTSLEEKISNIFINVGIPPHIKGYSFLREGVKMAVEDPRIINNITKKLYPSISEKYQTTPSKVERAIRHAIEVAWNRGRIESINNILGVRAYVGAEKPTNGEFIALVADKMLLEQA